MLSYCLKCRKNTESKKPKALKTRIRRTSFSSNCAICGREKSNFFKKQKANGLSGPNSTFSRIPLLGSIL